MTQQETAKEIVQLDDLRTILKLLLFNVDNIRKTIFELNKRVNDKYYEVCQRLKVGEEDNG